MGIVMYNGISSLDYGIQVEHPPEYRIPSRDYETIHIPGRNGDLVIDNGSYQNVNRSYKLAVGDRYKYFTEMAGGLSDWLHSASGYARLEDSYEPEYYRMAIFHNDVEIENILEHAGRVTVDFNCKPQRFLKSGERGLRIDNSGYVSVNPTAFSSSPIIIIHGNWEYGAKYRDWVRIIGDNDKYSELSFNGSRGVYKIVGEGNVGYHRPTYCLDCETGIVYEEKVDIESYRYTNMFSLSNGLPKLYPGKNIITFSTQNSAISYLEVVPRWWTI